MDIPQNKTQIIILAYSKVDKFVTTRVRDGLCAQVFLLYYKIFSFILC